MFTKVSRVELRLVLASVGVLFLSIAWLTAALTGVDLGHCLPGFQTADLHCPACYAAIAFLAAAVSPWPSPKPVRAGE
jgi:hypothetical protein